MCLDPCQGKGSVSEQGQARLRCRRARPLPWDPLTDHCMIKQNGAKPLTFPSCVVRQQLEGTILGLNSSFLGLGYLWHS